MDINSSLSRHRSKSPPSASIFRVRGEETLRSPCLIVNNEKMDSETLFRALICRLNAVVERWEYQTVRLTIFYLDNEILVSETLFKSLNL